MTGQQYHTTRIPFQRPDFHLLPASTASSSIQSLPDLVAYNSEKNPDHLFCLQAGSGRDIYITFADFQRAVLNCCNWLQCNVDSIKPAILTPQGYVQKGPAIALLLQSDIGLYTYIVALLSLNVPVRVLRRIGLECFLITSTVCFALYTS